MSARWWYDVATTSLVWAVYLLLGRSTDLVALLSTSEVGLGLRGLLFVLWFLLPIFVALDWRRIRDDVPWDPAIGPWLLVSVIWLANAAAGAAYCLRRESALRNTVPSGQWVYGGVAGLAFWASLVLVNLASAVIPTGVVGTVLSGPLVLVALVGCPLSFYLDAEHVRGHTHWNPSLRFWLVGLAVPVVNVVVGAVYLVRRRAEFEETSDPDTVELLGVDVEPTPPIPSPWYRRVALATGLYFLLFVVLGGTPGLVTLGLGRLAALLWLPFGVALLPMVYLDLAALADYGFKWGPTRYLYGTMLFLPPVAFVYLLRRSTVGRRALGL
ncbi:hypothetical protein NDI76_20595 [Halogeometricum sp. S1BR25-6]|uniref:Uncharacterized protein n=1 Tax=Halogeometricum salsisoli TaxID=2950536 RepID=A0ABU2GK31_9EURY|nr:hypothetical protein [Halogeometricum sp. S1BR25-6]MDS0301140.1 hypothetical protein [Halogeometricum sp. S1BR25-6]